MPPQKPRLTETLKPNSDQTYRQKSFPNCIITNRNQIAFTMHRLIWNQMDVRLVPNQSENGKYHLISVWFNKISKELAVQRDYSISWFPFYFFLQAKQNYFFLLFCTQSKIFWSIRGIARNSTQFRGWVPRSFWNQLAFISGNQSADIRFQCAQKNNTFLKRKIVFINDKSVLIKEAYP